MPWKPTDLVDVLVMGIVVALVVMLLCSFACGQTVTRVIDGDTLVLDTGQTVNLHGVDAPELDQPHGTSARNYLSILTLDRQVQLTDVREDGFGAISAGVFWRAIDISRAMVKQGGAWSLGAYDQEQRAAQADRKGLWRDPAVKPSSWRGRAADLPQPVRAVVLHSVGDIPTVYKTSTVNPIVCVGNT